MTEREYCLISDVTRLEAAKDLLRTVGIGHDHISPADLRLVGIQLTKWIADIRNEISIEVANENEESK